MSINVAKLDQLAMRVMTYKCTKTGILEFGKTFELGSNV
jgi:hypothetical protein